jgi:hypothetical protein
MIIDNYESNISYPLYIRRKPNGEEIFHKLINHLYQMKGVNLTIKCISCGKECHSNVFYCGICYYLLTKEIKTSSSFNN